MAGRQNGDGLIDDVLLVRLQVVGPAPLDELDHPAGVEVETERDAASVLGEVLHRKTQPTRAGGAQHEPVGAPGEVLVGEQVAEQLVVGPEVPDADAALGESRRAAGFEHEQRLILERLRNPAPDRAATQPVVLERGEAPQIVEAAHVGHGIEIEPLPEIEPEGTAGLLREVPADDLAHVLVEPGAGGGDRFG